MAPPRICGSGNTAAAFGDVAGQSATLAAVMLIATLIGVTVGNLNGDSKPDMVVSNWHDNNVMVRLNTSS